MHTVVIGTISIFLYLAAAVLLAVRLKNRETSSASKWRGLLPAIVAILLHGWMLTDLLFTPQGLDLGIYNTISLITLTIAGIILITAISTPTESLGVIIFPITALSIALENTFTSSHITQAWGTPIEIHILLSIIAYSILSIATVQAALLTVQDYHLRNKRPGGFIRALPPLQTMESLLFQMIGIGFVMQSLSLLSGLIFLDDMFTQHMVHKTVLSIFAWLVFATLLWGRWHSGWRGRTAVRWTVVGFILLALAFIGSKLVLEVILGRS